MGGLGEWVVGWMGGWVDGWLDGWVDGWMGGWVVGWLGGWVDGWMDRYSYLLPTPLSRQLATVGFSGRKKDMSYD